MGPTSSREQIEAYVNEVWPDYLRDLERLVAVPSVVDESASAPGAPWGPGCREALDVAMDIAECQGLIVGDCDGALAYGDLPGETGEQVATIAHVDVVPAGEGWDVEPFAVTRRDGVLLGRGVLDDKGPPWPRSMPRDTLPVARRLAVPSVAPSGAFSARPRRLA